MRLNPEEKFQISAVQYLRLCFPQCVVFAIKNESASHKTVQGRKLAVMKGLLPGIHDICVLAPFLCGLAETWEPHFIECKTRHGRLSETQKELHAKFDKLGIKHATCRSIDEIALAMHSWGIRSENKLDQIPPA